MNPALEQQRQMAERRNERQAAAIAGGLFALVMVLCFFLTAYSISIPPPGEQYVAVGFADLGESNEAAGDRESETPSETVSEATEADEATEEVAEVADVPDIVTQQVSDVVVPSDSDPKPDPEPEPEPEPEPQVSSALKNRLNALTQSGGGGGSQGTKNDGVGNEGAEDGQIEGRGVVSGDLGDAFLEGGSILGWPRLEEKPTKEGHVNVKIVVDKSGQVTSAQYDPLKSTLTDSYHKELALKAARDAKFTTSTTRPVRAGYITIRFELE